MNTILSGKSAAGGSSATSLLSRLNNSNSATGPSKPAGVEVREKFQDFASGTFYKQMLKALREGQKNSKYFHGGQAEEIFRGQMDQQVAEDLAHQHGAAFSGPLFDAYTRQARSGASPVSSSVNSSEPVHAFDAVA
jgi:hypothetical protein